MGYFLTIVAQSLDLQDSDFIQTVSVLNFVNQVFVSWSPTPEQPDQNEKWYWLASNTLRVSKGRGQFVDINTYHDTPIERRSDGQIVYRWEWANYSGSTIIHLALPPNFIAELQSLHPNIPAYIKMNRGRLCLGWLPSPESAPAYAFNLIETASDFENSVGIFTDQFEAMKHQEPLKSRIAHARKLSNIYTSKIQHLEEQLAIYGTANVPFHIQYELDETQKALQEQQSILTENRQ